MRNRRGFWLSLLLSVSVGFAVSTDGCLAKRKGAKGPAPAIKWPMDTDDEKQASQAPSKPDQKPGDDKAQSTTENQGTQEEKPQPPKGKHPYAEQAVKHYNRGVELHESGFLNQAIGEYKQAIEADPDMEEAYSNLGLIYTAQRSYAKAIESFNKALELKPGRTYTLNGLATVLYARGHFKEALEKWQQAIAADPHFTSAYFNMGTAFENEKEYAQAVNAYVKAIKIRPNMADPYYKIGTIFDKDNDKHIAQAQLLLNKAVGLAPDGDFVRDAKRQLSDISEELAREQPDTPDIKMNIMAPPSPGEAKTQTPPDATTSGK